MVSVDVKHYVYLLTSRKLQDELWRYEHFSVLHRCRFLYTVRCIYIYMHISMHFSGCFFRFTYKNNNWVFVFHLNVALRPLKPPGLLGTGSPGPPPRLSHSSSALKNQGWKKRSDDVPPDQQHLTRIAQLTCPQTNCWLSGFFLFSFLLLFFSPLKAVSKILKSRGPALRTAPTENLTSTRGNINSKTHDSERPNWFWWGFGASCPRMSGWHIRDTL